MNTYRRKRPLVKYAPGGLTPDQQAYYNAISSGSQIAEAGLDAAAQPKGLYAGSTTAATASGALKGASEGASIGKNFGIEGAIIGGAAGLVIGGVSSFIGAEGKRKKMDGIRAQTEQTILNQNKDRSTAELNQYPATGVQGVQYYSKGGFILKNYNDKYGSYYDEGGTVGPGGDKPLATINRNPISFPLPNDPYWKLHPLMTEHSDGTFRRWGETPTVIDTRTLRQKLGNAVSDEQPSSIVPTNIINGAGDGARPAMISQRQGPVVQAVHSTSGYYSRGGALSGNLSRHRPLPQFPALNQYPFVVDPDQLEKNEVNGQTSYNQLAQGGNVPNPQYEVEQGEVVQGNPQLEQSQQLSSDMHLVGGNTHENGGTDGAGGERVFSDRLKVSSELAEMLKGYKLNISPNATYADAAKKFGNIKGKMEDKVKSNYTPSINTGTKILDRVEQATDALFQDQEMQKAMTSQSPKMRNGGMIKYDDGGDIENYATYAKQLGLPTNQLSASGNTNSNPLPDSGQVVPFSYANPHITPDVHPDFGHQVLDTINNNQGEITNFASYLSNLGSIHGLDTATRRNYVTPPVYSYVNRSGEGIASNLRQYNSAIRSMTNSSKGVNGSNAGAYYAATLEANSKLHNAENMRMDAYNENYGQRSDRIGEFNSDMFAKAQDEQRDLQNNKNVTLPLQARNAFLQGVMANQQVKAQQRADRVKMALAISANDQHGVITRFLKNYNSGGKEGLEDLLKNYGFGD